MWSTTDNKETICCVNIWSDGSIHTKIHEGVNKQRIDDMMGVCCGTRHHLINSTVRHTKFPAVKQL